MPRDVAREVELDVVVVDAETEVLGEVILEAGAGIDILDAVVADSDLGQPPDISRCE